MNLTFQESLDLASKINEYQFNNIDVKVAPAFTYLQKLSDYLSSSKIEVIAQNVHHEIRGAYAGQTVSFTFMFYFSLNFKIYI